MSLLLYLQLIYNCFVYIYCCEMWSVDIVSSCA
uniref:Uncharacterized protein n=1 Tax=Anguilla anguilla TaxID=7936 RepID=A0A0E9VJI3_ANGAN